MPSKPGGSKNRRLLIAAAVILLLAGLGLLPSSAESETNHSVLGTQHSVLARPDTGKIPLAFEPNAGQTDPQVYFMAHQRASTLYFSPSEVALAVGPPDKKSDANIGI